ncbi:MAG: hypothetical protein FWD04_07555 [Conexibacteraceae bacterium]|nr:hypothetical protein [Conexibacteraceae bacterium]
MKIAALAVLAVAALAVPTSALAAPVLGAPIPIATTAQAVGAPSATPDPTGAPLQPLNVASDRSTLNAYAQYLSALVKDAPQAELSDTTYVATISSGCKGALAQLAAPSNQLVAAMQHTLTVLGQEMGNDLAITFDQAALTPFAKLSATLSRLRWTRLSGGGAIVRRFLTTESAVLNAPTSTLCQNALLAASKPRVVPLATRNFNQAYAKASRQANTAMNNLLTLLQTDETAGEHAVVTRIAGLAAQYNKLSNSELVTNGSTLANALKFT